MITDLSKAYEVLGVKPGVSSTELKAAHRDLAKVWHPDRFLHDPRLQEKAQEKLKEINEAYEIVSSGKVPRAATPPPPPRPEPPRVHYTVEREEPVRQGINWKPAVAALLLFAAVFAVTTRSLLLKRGQAVPEQTVEAKEAENAAPDRSTRPDGNTRVEVRNTPKNSEAETAAPEVTSPVSVPAQSAPAVATVTVAIDPESGLLAKPECPLRSRMTYPSGSQPTAYCNLNHAPPPKDSKLKSIAKTVKRTLD